MNNIDSDEIAIIAKIALQDIKEKNRIEKINYLKRLDEYEDKKRSILISERDDRIKKRKDQRNLDKDVKNKELQNKKYGEDFVSLLKDKKKENIVILEKLKPELQLFDEDLQKLKKDLQILKNIEKGKDFDKIEKLEAEILVKEKEKVVKEEEIRYKEEFNNKIDKFLEIHPPSIMSKLSIPNLTSNIYNFFQNSTNKNINHQEKVPTTNIKLLFRNSITNPELNDLSVHDIFINNTMNPLNIAINNVDSALAGYKLNANSSRLSQGIKGEKGKSYSKDINIKYNKK